jgi:hypothetical protein
MRSLLLFILALLALTFAACSYVTEFVVVNESGQPIEVRYKVKGPPVGPPAFSAAPAKRDASQLGTRDRSLWKKLEPGEYRIDAENRTVTVVVLPHEALWVTSMHHYIGDEDPNDVANWPIEEISVTGADGGRVMPGVRLLPLTGHSCSKWQVHLSIEP